VNTLANAVVCKDKIRPPLLMLKLFIASSDVDRTNAIMIMEIMVTKGNAFDLFIFYLCVTFLVSISDSHDRLT
jgi:hypothetical protein